MFSVHISSYGFTRETDWRALKKRKSNIRELKQLRRQGQWKRHLELESALFQTSSLQFYLVQYVKYGRIFLELILNQKQEKGNRYSLVFTSSITLEVKKIHVVVVQGRQRYVQKSVMHLRSCCFA